MWEAVKKVFSSLKLLKSKAGSSIRHIVALDKQYHEGGEFKVDEHEKKTAPDNCSGRTIKGYANLIWFTEQVCCTYESLLYKLLHCI